MAINREDFFFVCPRLFDVTLRFISTILWKTSIFLAYFCRFLQSTSQLVEHIGTLIIPIGELIGPMYHICRTFSAKLKYYAVSKIVLTFNCLKQLF